MLSSIILLSRYCLIDHADFSAFEILLITGTYLIRTILVAKVCPAFYWASVAHTKFIMQTESEDTSKLNFRILLYCPGYNGIALLLTDQ